MDEREQPSRWTPTNAPRLTLPDLERGRDLRGPGTRGHVSRRMRAPGRTPARATANRPPTATSVILNSVAARTRSAPFADYNETGSGRAGCDVRGRGWRHADLFRGGAASGVAGREPDGAAGEAKLRATLLNQGAIEV